MSDIRIVRNGFPPIQDRDGTNTVVRQYTWGLDMGGGIGGLLDLKQSGQNYSYLYDGKGNVTAVIDGSENVVDEYAYGPFGEPWAKTATIDQPFRFSTKRYDEQTGLSYYGYRFYSHHIGTWVTRDPLGETGGINLYAFVDNNPVNWADPWGLRGKRIWKKKRKGVTISNIENHSPDNDPNYDHVHWKTRDGDEGANYRDGTKVHPNKDDDPTNNVIKVVSEEYGWKWLLAAEVGTMKRSMQNSCRMIITNY